MTFAFSPGMELYSVWTAALYRAVAASPLVAQSANAVFGALACLAVGATARALFNRRAGALAAILVALWPSHAFYTSQNSKEAPALLLLALVLFALVSGFGRRAVPERTLRLVPTAAAALVLGFFRSHLLPFLAGAALTSKNGPLGAGTHGSTPAFAAAFDHARSKAKPPSYQ